MGNRNSRPKELKISPTVEAKKIEYKGRVVGGLIALLGVIITAVALVKAYRSPVELSMQGTQTAEAKFTKPALIFTRTPTVSPITATLLPSLTSTTFVTYTSTPTSPSSEPKLPDGYVMYDNFEKNSISKWEFPPKPSNNSSLCKFVITDGGTQI